MKLAEAQQKVKQIEKLVEEIYRDEELHKIEPRYRIAAKWCDMDIECVDLG